MYNWYLRGLFEPTHYHENKYKNIDPTRVPDSLLLEIICELTGLTEPEVINEASREIRTRMKTFEWNFDNYFKGHKFLLHPLIRKELCEAYYILQKEPKPSNMVQR